MADRPASPPAGIGVASDQVAGARAVSGAALLDLIRSAREDSLAELLDNPSFDKDHASLLPVLLDRKDLSEATLDRIAKRTRWMTDPVRRKIAAHPRTSRRVAMRLLREFHLLDLVQFSLQPAIPPEARRLAEESLAGRIGQLPLGQKKMLARRCSAQVAGALLADSSAAVVDAALDNPFLGAAQVLKALSARTLGVQTVSAIGRHAKWSQQAAVRVAIVAHPHAPTDLVLAFLPGLSRSNLEDLGALAHVPAGTKQYFQHELARRSRVAPPRAARSASGEPPAR